MSLHYLCNISKANNIGCRRISIFIFSQFNNYQCIAKLVPVVSVLHNCHNISIGKMFFKHLTRNHISNFGIAQYVKTFTSLVNVTHIITNGNITSKISLSLLFSNKPSTLQFFPLWPALWILSFLTHFVNCF